MDITPVHSGMFLCATVTLWYNSPTSFCMLIVLPLQLLCCCTSEKLLKSTDSEGQMIHLLLCFKHESLMS